MVSLKINKLKQTNKQTKAQSTYMPKVCWFCLRASKWIVSFRPVQRFISCRHSANNKLNSLQFGCAWIIASLSKLSLSFMIEESWLLVRKENIKVLLQVPSTFDWMYFQIQDGFSNIEFAWWSCGSCCWRIIQWVAIFHSLLGLFEECDSCIQNPHKLITPCVLIVKATFALKNC